VIKLAELVDCPILIVHVSTPDGIEAIRAGARQGLEGVWRDCPQYLFLTAKDIDIGIAGRDCFCCMPGRRADAAAQERAGAG